MAKANPFQLRLWSDIECRLWSSCDPIGTPEPVKELISVRDDPWADCMTPGCEERRKRPAPVCVLCHARIQRASEIVRKNRTRNALTTVEMRGLSVRV